MGRPSRYERLDDDERPKRKGEQPFRMQLSKIPCRRCWQLMLTAEVASYGSQCEDCYCESLPPDPKGPDWPFIRRDESAPISRHHFRGR